MRLASRAAVLLLALMGAGCNQRTLEAGPGTSDLAVAFPSDVDLGVAPDLALRSTDLALRADDLAETCVLAGENASVTAPGQTLTYAWFGNQGGTRMGQSCELFGQVSLLLGTNARAPTDYPIMEPRAEITIYTPLQLGTQTVEVKTNVGGDAQVTASVELTDYTVDALNAVTSIAGRLTTADGSWDGSFAAVRCPLLEWVCI
jgi:hypothetical protein